jgi:hypothetical protein
MFILQNVGAAPVLGAGGATNITPCGITFGGCTAFAVVLSNESTQFEPMSAFEAMPTSHESLSQTHFADELAEHAIKTERCAGSFVVGNVIAAPIDDKSPRNAEISSPELGKLGTNAEN